MASCRHLRVDQLDGAVLSLAGPPFADPASEDAGGPGVVGLLLLEVLEALLELDDQLGLPVEALLAEGLFFFVFGDLDLRTSPLRADLEEMGAGALGVYSSKDWLESRGNASTYC